MTPEDARERKALNREVRYGQTTPAEADAILEEWGQKPFQARPDPSRSDPMAEAEWTLPMAAAWFIWRSPDAVRDQWNVARNGWRKWVCVPRQVRKLGGPHGPSWKLTCFGLATLQDVFREAGLTREVNEGKANIQRSTESNSVHTPYRRLKRALQSGDLQATWGRLASDDFEALLPEYWQREFEAIANPKKQPLPERMAPAHLGSMVKILISQGSTPKPLKPVQSHSEAKPAINLNEMEDLPDLSLIAASPLKTGAVRLGDAILYAENTEIFVRREDVISAERRVSQIEYDQPDWNLGQALGWIAYRNRDSFRSLWETDLNPRPTFYGEVYSPDFVTSDPAGALKNGLLSEKLKGYQDGEPIPSTRWIGSEVWARSHMSFMRADVIKAWKEIPLAATPKIPRPSEAKLIEIYKQLHMEIGDVPTEREFQERLKKLGFKATVLSARAACKKYCEDNKLERNVGPRPRPRKPHSGL